MVVPHWCPVRIPAPSPPSERTSRDALLDAIHERVMLLWLFEDQLQVTAAFVDRVDGSDFDVEDTVTHLLRGAGRVPSELFREPADTRVGRSSEREASIFIGWLHDRVRPRLDGPTGLCSARLAGLIRVEAALTGSELP
jgi:hypothetical protein